MLRPQRLFFLLAIAAIAGCSEDAPATEPDTGLVELDADAEPDTAPPPDTELADSAVEEDAAEPIDSEAPDTFDATPDATFDTTFDGGGDVEEETVEAAVDAPDAEDAADVSDAAEVDAGPPIVCTSVTVNDVSFGSSKEVRQGYGSLQLNVVGTNLGDVTTVTLLGAPCTIVLKTATTALVTCSVAHAAPLGGALLVLANASTSGSCVDAITVTKITTNAASSSSSDTTGLGTPFKPFKSIGRGLSVADAGDTVHVLANGTSSYGSTTTVDNFVNIGTSTNPYGTPTANVKAGVTIEGDTRTGQVTRIVGTKNAGTLVFRLAGDATIKNLVIDGFRYSISANAGTVALANVSFKNAGGDALVVFGSAKATVTGPCDFDLIEGSGVNTAGTVAVTMTGCNLHNHNAHAISINGMSSLTGTGLKVYANGRDSTTAPTGYPGIWVRESGTLSLTSSDVNGNYQGGVFGEASATIELTTSRVFNNGKRVGSTTNTASSGGTRMDGVRITEGKALTIVAGQIYDNGASGIGAYESSNYTGLTLSVNGTNIQGNFFDGLRFDCDGKLVVRNAIFEDNGGNGLQLENGPTLIDLGTALVPGNNTLRRLAASTTTGTSGHALLGDFRPARISADGVIVTVSGTTLQGTMPPAAMKTGPTTSTTSGQLLYEIANSNNRVQFF
jgi:hypothetical protein